MSPKPTGTTHCQNASCGKKIEQKPGPGRPRMYCDDACRARSNHATITNQHRRAQDTSRHIHYLIDLAREHQTRSTGLVDLVQEANMPMDQAVSLVSEMFRSLDNVMAAVVQRARDQGEPVRAIADAVRLAPATVRRRWPEGSIDRRMENRPATKPRSAPPQQTPVRTRRRTRSTNSSSGAGERTAASPTRPSPASAVPPTVLARALRNLQRDSGQTRQSLADSVGVTPSYISHILHGRRRPSWKVTRQITLACGGDPEEIRPLWEVERPAGQAQTSFFAAMRGLHLSADHPQPRDLRETVGHIQLADITGTLQGTRTPDWPAVRSIVHALHGDPDALLPLWQAATHHQATNVPTRAAWPQGELDIGPQAAAFG